MIWVAYGMLFGLGWKLMSWPLDWAAARLGIADKAYDRLADRIIERLNVRWRRYDEG